jgi:hypothetical protein
MRPPMSKQKWRRRKVPRWLVRCAPHQAMGSLIPPDLCYGGSLQRRVGELLVPERRSPCIGLLTSAELGAVCPHPVQDDGEAAGQGDDRRSPHETTRPRKTPRGSALRQSGDCDPPAPVIPCQGPRGHGGPTPGPWGLSRGPHSACPGRAPGGRPPSTAMPRRSRRRRRCARRSTRVQDPDPVHFVLGQSRRAGDP